MVMTPQRGSSPNADPGPGRGGDSEAPLTVRIRVRRVFDGVGTDYVLLLAVTLFLIAFGLIMVLSSASVTDFASRQDFFSTFTRQALIALVGLPLMLIASKLPVVFWRKWAWVFLFVSIGLQVMVFTSAGLSHGINRNWVSIFGFTLQPSEFMKLALVVWLGLMLTQRLDRLDRGKELLKALLPVLVITFGLVLFGGDLGTAIVMAILVYGVLYFAGIRWLYLIGSGVVVAAGAFAFALISPSRVERIEQFFQGICEYEGGCWQITHASYALSAGGFFGVGLGNSSAKWSWLPHVENDFIFAVIGEELGMLGALIVILLFVALAAVLVRIIATTQDPFARIITGGVMTWLIGQAFVNIAVVLGLLPVLGVPLPFISAGGSSLLASMLAIGVVLSFARNRGERQARR